MKIQIKKVQSIRNIIVDKENTTVRDNTPRRSIKSF